MNAAAKRHRLTCMRRREYFRRLGKGCFGTPAPTVRSMVPTSTRAHEHTSTQYPTYPAAEKPDHTRQHLPCRSTEIRHQHAPRCASLPRRPATQAPTVSSIIPAAHTEARRTRHAAAQKTPRHEPARPNRRPLHPKHPMSPACHRGGLHFEQAHGGFATIDPRHAGDTPQSSAYGSNSPKPPTKTSHTTTTNRRRHAEHDPRHHTTSDIGNGLTH